MKLQAGQGARQSQAVPVLSHLVTRARTKFTFTYDFGDDWKHLIEVEKIGPAEPGVHYPRCTDGARANPIEDCGGAWDLAELVAAAGNPQHPRFPDLEEWGLEKWDPAQFSVEEANRELAKAFRRRN
jgi:Plasmid pRiA4b ORF-3-like protein